ncbi:hypothetical protein F5B20DRAFT_586073 [Whalleya microplaca]|nr:hypothetical protein F5B20DRAFT_586073 [Whalleya microplaca]
MSNMLVVQGTKRMIMVNHVKKLPRMGIMSFAYYITLKNERYTNVMKWCDAMWLETKNGSGFWDDMSNVEMAYLYLALAIMGREVHERWFFRDDPCPGHEQYLNMLRRELWFLRYNIFRNDLAYIGKYGDSGIRKSLANAALTLEAGVVLVDRLEDLPPFEVTARGTPGSVWYDPKPRYDGPWD